MLQNLDFDFSLFEDVPSPKSHNTVCRLPLAAEDRLSQNEAFHRALQGTTAFRLQVSSDGRFLRLDPNGPCNLTFTNAGKTIPKEKLDRIFERFFRLDESRSSNTGGAGLGLAIAKEIVEQHGGAISAASADGGISFTVSLPQPLPQPKA